MYRLICQKPALVCNFFKMFTVLGMYNFEDERYLTKLLRIVELVKVFKGKKHYLASL